MNSGSNVGSGAVAADVAAGRVIPWWRLMVWSVRRELWESRSIYLAPLFVAPVALIGFVVNAVRLAARMGAPGSEKNLHEAILQPYDFMAGLFMVTTLIVAIIYSLDALYGERRDRSILFWKSLPVSDTTTVLAKASIPIVFLPLFGFVITVVLQSIMVLIHAAIVAGHGVSVAAFWNELSFGRMSGMLLYHLLFVHGLSWAPFFGWMLLVSAWSRRAPFVWAVLPLVTIAIVEKIAFNTSHFAGMMGERFSGQGSVAMTASGGMPMLDPMATHITPVQFLASPGFLSGLLITALFLAAAVRLRRYQVPN